MWMIHHSDFLWSWYSVLLSAFCQHRPCLLHWTTSPHSSGNPSHPKVGAACEPPWLEPLLRPLADCPDTQKGNDHTAMAFYSLSFLWWVCAIVFFIYGSFYSSKGNKKGVNDPSITAGKITCFFWGPGNTSNVANVEASFRIVASCVSMMLEPLFPRRPLRTWLEQSQRLSSDATNSRRNCQCQFCALGCRDDKHPMNGSMFSSSPTRAGDMSCFWSFLPTVCHDMSDMLIVFRACDFISN